jgi:hypothetical protein
VTRPESCRVRGCKRPADMQWEPGMGTKYGMTVPVCLHHFKLRLWWHRGWIFCKDEESQ